jgi:hypothetical protein
MDVPMDFPMVSYWVSYGFPYSGFRGFGVSGFRAFGVSGFRGFGCPMDFPMDFLLGFPMDFLWLSHEFPMNFLWISPKNFFYKRGPGAAPRRGPGAAPRRGCGGSAPANGSAYQQKIPTQLKLQLKPFGLSCIGIFC